MKQCSPSQISSSALIFLCFGFCQNLTSAAHSAEYCNQGLISPILIVGDNESQFTALATFGSLVSGHTDNNGDYPNAPNHAIDKTRVLDGETLLSDRVQAGFTLPVVELSNPGSDVSGLGDFTTRIGYEYLTDWTYNPFRPKGIGFLELTLPTGKTKFESSLGELDTNGNGFWSVGGGTLLTKVVEDFDVFLSLEAHRNFSKSINTTQLSGTLYPGTGGSMGFGVGYTLDAFRFGAALSWSLESPIRFSGLNTQFESEFERYSTASLSMSYFATEEWAGTITYLDQTWFSDSVNTNLARSVALQIQRSWPR